MVPLLVDHEPQLTQEIIGAWILYVGQQVDDMVVAMAKPTVIRPYRVYPRLTRQDILHFIARDRNITLRF